MTCNKCIMTYFIQCHHVITWEELVAVYVQVIIQINILDLYLYQGYD